MTCHIGNLKKFKGHWWHRIAVSKCERSFECLSEVEDPSGILRMSLGVPQLDNLSIL